MNHYCYYKKQQGVSLVGAIFIMVALAAIGAAMVTLNSVTTTTSALNIEQKRAYYAAKSGMEWAIYKVIEDNDKNNLNSCTGVTKVLADNFEVSPFKVTIKCDTTCVDSSTCCDLNVSGDCTLNPRVTTIEVTASKGNPGEIYNVSRTIQTTISYDGN